MSDIASALVPAVGIIIVILVVALAWEFSRSAYYWTAAKLMGWDDHEKFMRETQWIEKKALRAQRQNEKDATVEGADHRRLGAFVVTLAVAAISWRLNMSWWEVAGVIALTYFGLHMVAGVAIKWWD